MAIVIQQEGGPIGPVNTVYRLSTFAYLQGQIGMINLSYRLVTAVGPGGDPLGAIVQALYDLYVTTWKAAISNSAVTVGAKIAQLSPGVKPLAGIVADGAACNGGAGALPQVVSGLVKLTTAASGRAYRGRFYVPFPYAASVDTDQTPLAAYVAKVQTLSDALLSAALIVTPTATTYTFFPVIWHRKAGKTGVPAANTYDAVVGYFVEKQWASQHRRGDFGRLNANAIH